MTRPIPPPADSSNFFLASEPWPDDDFDLFSCGACAATGELVWANTGNGDIAVRVFVGVGYVASTEADRPDAIRVEVKPVPP